jgi:penicillin-binding protein 2
MQLAVAYAALANDGNIVTPHLGMDIRDANGTVVQRIDPGVRRHLNLNPAYRAAILQGLHEAAQSSGGTSYDVMGNFPLPVYGKTGTAQYSGQNDYAWYACFVPGSATRKPIVIVVTVERGGFGDIAAAPVARQMLNQWFLGHAGAYKAGTGQTL